MLLLLCNILENTDCFSNFGIGDNYLKYFTKIFQEHTYSFGQVACHIKYEPNCVSFWNYSQTLSHYYFAINVISNQPAY